MASFIAKLFGGDKKKSPAPSAVEAPKPTPPTTGGGGSLGSVANAVRRMRPARATKSIYTDALGLTREARSGMITKRLTGQ